MWYSSDYSKKITWLPDEKSENESKHEFLKRTCFSAALQKLKMLNLQSGMGISSVPFILLFDTDSVKG